MNNFDQALQAKIDGKTKPVGSLGAIEFLAKKVATIQQTLTPDVSKPVAFVFGADHGICEEGVNPYPQVVTEQMLANFAHEGAAMSVFCKTNAIPLHIINMGIVNAQARWPNVQHYAIAPGTQNFRRKPAMTAEQCELAINTGIQLATQAVENGANLLMIGEMGIGNTSSASALLSALTHTTAQLTVGPGTGANQSQLELKITVINEAIKRCEGQTAREILANVGGFEIAAMVGVLLAGRTLRVPVMVDGFISTAAALVAEYDQPNSKECWIFSHQSAEPAHTFMLKHLQVAPILGLDLRLGEGTGCALAYPIVKCAVAMLNTMASFESAGISES